MSYFINEKKAQIERMKGTSRRYRIKNILIQRMLSEEPAIFILVNPLKEMDVSSSAMLKETISGMKKAGSSALVFSSSQATLQTLCDHMIPV